MVFSSDSQCSFCGWDRRRHVPESCLGRDSTLPVPSALQRCQRYSHCPWPTSPRIRGSSRCWPCTVPSPYRRPSSLLSGRTCCRLRQSGPRLLSLQSPAGEVASPPRRTPYRRPRRRERRHQTLQLSVVGVSRCCSRPSCRECRAGRSSLRSGIRSAGGSHQRSVCTSSGMSRAGTVIRYSSCRRRQFPST